MVSKTQPNRISTAMGVYMKGNGMETREMERAYSDGLTPVEPYTPDNSWMIKDMGKEKLHTLTELTTQATGRQIREMVLESLHGQIVQVMKEISQAIRCMARENSHGQLVHTTKGDGKETKRMDKEKCTVRAITALMKETGLKINAMVKEQ